MTLHLNLKSLHYLRINDDKIKPTPAATNIDDKGLRCTLTSISSVYSLAVFCTSHTRPRPSSYNSLTNFLPSLTRSLAASLTWDFFALFKNSSLLCLSI